MQSVMNPTPQQEKGMIKSPQANKESAYYADGGVVQPGKQVNQQSPGGRSGSGSSFQLDGITLAQALQSPDEILNPRMVRQLISGGNPTEQVGAGDNSGNAEPSTGYNQGLQGFAGPMGMALGGMTGVPGMGIGLSIALGMMDNAAKAQDQQAKTEAIQADNAAQGAGNSGMGQNSGGGLGGIGTAATAGAPIGVDMGTADPSGLGMGQGPGSGGIGEGSTGEGGIGGASGDGPGYGKVEVSKEGEPELQILFQPT
jgi:hypothetical protein